MDNNAIFTEVVGYFERFHKDVSQLAILIERLLDDEGYKSLPDIGNSAGRGLASHYRRPSRWRMRYICRYYTASEGDLLERSIFFLIYLGGGGQFEFPPILCGVVKHEPLNARRIYKKIYRQTTFRSLITDKTKWSGWTEPGWSIAKPTWDLQIGQLKGYILNLFELNNRDLVIDNVIKPLTQPSLPYNNDKSLTRYQFPIIDPDYEIIE